MSKLGSYKYISFSILFVTKFISQREKMVIETLLDVSRNSWKQWKKKLVGNGLRSCRLKWRNNSWEDREISKCYSSCPKRNVYDDHDDELGLSKDKWVHFRIFQWKKDLLTAKYIEDGCRISPLGFANFTQKFKMRLGHGNNSTQPSSFLRQSTSDCGKHSYESIVWIFVMGR